MNELKKIDSLLIKDFTDIQIRWGKWENEYQQLLERYRERLQHCKQKQKKITEYFDSEVSS